MNDRELKEIQLNNVNVDMRTATNGKDYFIIFDNEGIQGESAYFCFRGSNNLNHEDFERLSANWHNITRIQLTYFEKEYQGRSSKQVVSFKLPSEEIIV